MPMIENVRRSRGPISRCAILALIFGLAPLGTGWADSLIVRHGLVPVETHAITDGDPGGGAEIQVVLQSRGAGLAAVGSKSEEPVTVVLRSASHGAPSSAQFLGTETIVFSDDSTIVLQLDGHNDGKHFSASIVGASGTGRFKGIRAFGSLNGDVFDPKLAYVVIRGDYTLE